MAYEKDICGDCLHLTDVGRCVIPQVRHQERSFFSPACVWFTNRNAKQETTMDKYTIKGDKNETRTCSECGRTLPLEQFHKNRWGFTKICKECHAKKAAARVKKTNAEKKDQKIREEKPAVVVHRLHQHYSPEVVADALRDATDQQLVDELSGRGWRGSVVKEVSMDII